VAILLPSDFDLRRLVDSERKVVQALVAGLDDSWFLVPSVEVSDGGQDGEIDIVLVSSEGGAFVIEVKGGLIRVEGDKWFSYDKQIQSPVAQVKRAKHLLVARLGTMKVRAPFLDHLVAFPDVNDVPETGIGVGLARNKVLGSVDLADPTRAIARARDDAHRERPPLSTQVLTKFLQALSPRITLGTGGANLAPVARQRINESTRLHITSLLNLDANSRVLVTGGAGTGKTWLIEQWALRAAQRGERVCVICFNKPIADHLSRLLRDTSAFVGTYHDIVRRLLEPFHELDVPPNAGEEFWGVVPTQRLIEFAESVGAPFDTIIVDEFQDVRHNWVPSIDMLLDPAGARKLLMVADPAQDIYVRDWRPPKADVVLPLEYNLRCSRPVAEVVEHLGGPKPMPGALGTFPVLHWRAGGLKEIRKRLIATLELLTNDHGVPLREIAVLTASTKLRDELLGNAESGRLLPLARWEERHEEAALCETIHRGKGLERAAVVIIDNSDDPKRQLIYVGASRAMWSLTLIGQDSLAELCGVGANSAAALPAYQSLSS